MIVFLIRLSSRCGLIRMIPKAISLFDIYRQSRQSSMALATSDDDDDLRTISPAHEFTTRLHAALLDANLPITTPRKSWPTHLIDRVYADLVTDADHAAIHRELVASSVGMRAYMAKRERFARTLAEASVVGHVCGIGDRHLGNIMLDVGTGAVIQIDFAVCFGRGQSLQIQETVPFRLTPSLIDVMGPYALDGGTFAQHMTTHLTRVDRQAPHLLTIIESLCDRPLDSWRRPRSAFDDAVMIHQIVVDTLRRYRDHFASLHALVMHGAMASYAERHNRSAAIRHQIAMRQGELSSVCDAIDAVHVGNGSTASLGPLRERQRRLQSALDDMDVVDDDVIDDADHVTIIDADRNLWYRIRPLVNWLARRDSVVAAALRADWDRATGDAKQIRANGVESVDVVASYRQLFDTIKLFLNADRITNHDGDGDAAADRAARKALDSVRQKLFDRSGTDQDVVNDLIAMATDATRLAQLYEGWAAWW